MVEQSGRSGRVSPLRSVAVLIVALVIGFAVTLQFRGWWAVATEAGGRCGTGRYGHYYGPCPRGTTPVLLLSILGLVGGLVVLGFLLAGLGRGRVARWVRLAMVPVGVVGILPGNAVYTWAHGPGNHALHTVWALPLEQNPQLDGEGSWIVGDTVVRAQLDQLAAYGVNGGETRWTYTIPDPQLLCAASRSVSEGVAVVAFGPQSGPCGTVVGLDLTSGRQLWQTTLTGSELPNQATPDFVSVAGDLAVLAALPGGDGVTALDLHTGALRWQQPLPDGCSAAAVGAAVVAVVRCAQIIGDADISVDYTVDAFDPNTGAPRWSTPISGSDADVTGLSFDPPLVEVRGTDVRGGDELWVLDDSGRVADRIDATSTGLSLSSSGFQAVPSPPFALADGMLIAQTSSPGAHSQNLTALSLSTGATVWSKNLQHNSFQAITRDGDRIVTLTERGFHELLTGYDVRTGASHPLGTSSADLLTATAALHVLGQTYIVVCADASIYPPALALR
jgi:outer membrane protein assembly factor BamB